MKNLEPAGDLTIGEIAQRTGCTVPTVRYYEEIGLIPPAKRRSSGHRVYQSDSEELLSFIRRCRDFGFAIEQVRELVSLSKSRDRDCNETLEIALAHLAAVRAKMAEMRALERSLARFVTSCSEMCAGGPAAECSILKDMTTQPEAARKGCCG